MQQNISIKTGESQENKRCGIYKDSQVSLPIATLNTTQLRFTWTLHVETSGTQLWILGRKRASLAFFVLFGWKKWQTGHWWFISKACIFPNSDPCTAAEYAKSPCKMCWSWWDYLKQIIYWLNLASVKSPVQTGYVLASLQTGRSHHIASWTVQHCV